MTAPTPYLHLPGTARDALSFYAGVFGCGVTAHSFAEVGRLAAGGRVVPDLQRRPWGASDGQVVDRFGVHWLIGFE